MKKHVQWLFLAMLLLNGWQFTCAANFAGCCKPPSDVEFACEELPYDFDPYDVYQLQHLFGKAKNWCNPGLVVELDPIVDLSSCETGTIIRRFRASNNYGSYDHCEQKITITGSHEYKIRFPADVELSCGQSPTREDVIVKQSSCDYLVVNVKDHEFFEGNRKCGKIIRTYKVINWCEYDTQSSPVVINRDEDCDGDPGDEDVWVIRRSYGYAFIDRNGDEHDGNPGAGERRTCSPSNPKGYWRKVYSKGYWQYTQHIKIGDNEAPEITAETPEPFCSFDNATCKAFVQIPFKVDDDCTPNDIITRVLVDGEEINRFSGSGNFTASGLFDLGVHELEIRSEDGCGNPATEKIPFEVNDCKAPTPTCINGLTVTLMPLPREVDVNDDGEFDVAAMTIWAEDLLVRKPGDCSGIAGYSINRAGETPDFNQKSLTVTCDDPSTLNIEVYAWDDAFNPTAVQPDGTMGGRNYTFCETYLLIQDNNNFCGEDVGMGFIAGKVYTESGYGLQDVNMMLISQDSNFLYTHEDGRYHFDSIPMQASYRVVPVMNTNPMEGISIVDLILLHRHVVGIEPIRSPYRLIAADINRDGAITEDDVNELRNMMLGVESEFTSNHSWRFIKADYVFPDPLNPWREAFPEFMEISDMSEVENYGDFIAVKIGDINGSIVSDRLGAESRTVAALAMQLPDQQIKPGATVAVPVQANLQGVAGMQLALQFDAKALEIAGVTPGIIDESHMGIRSDENVLSIAWNGAPSATTDISTLFTLHVKGKASSNLREVLWLSSRRIEPIAQRDENIARLELDFSQASTEISTLRLFQNVPNPFRQETMIRFALPEAGSATIRINDLSGRELWRQQSYFDAGNHQIMLRRKELNTSGVLLYTIETDAYRATRRMVVLP
jgi:hypothetical protein